MPNKVVHGARIKVVFEKTEIGVLTNITENEDYTLQAIHGIGHFTPQEIVALQFTGNFNYSSMVLSTDNITNLKYAQRSGKSAVAVAKAIMTQEGFTLDISDKYNGDTIAVIGMCKMGNLSLQIGENTIMQRSGSGRYGIPLSVPGIPESS